MLIGKAKSANEAIDLLQPEKPGKAVEYFRGKDLRYCESAGEFWLLALYGKLILAQKRYGEFDYGWWAIKPEVETPLPPAFHALGLDYRGRDKAMRNGGGNTGVRRHAQEDAEGRTDRG